MVLRALTTHCVAPHTPHRTSSARAWCSIPSPSPLPRCTSTRMPGLQRGKAPPPGMVGESPSSLLLSSRAQHRARSSRLASKTRLRRRRVSLYLLFSVDLNIDLVSHFILDPPPHLSHTHTHHSSARDDEGRAPGADPLRSSLYLSSLPPPPPFLLCLKLTQYLLYTHTHSSRPFLNKPCPRKCATLFPASRRPCWRKSSWTAIRQRSPSMAALRRTVRSSTGASPTLSTSPRRAASSVLTTAHFPRSLQGPKRR